MEQRTKKIHDKQRRIGFHEDDHTYWYKDTQLTPVSRTIEPYKNEFDPHDKIAHAVAKKEGRSVRDIKRGWKKQQTDAAHFGTQVHEFLEAVALKRTLPLLKNERVVSYVNQGRTFLSQLHFEGDSPIPAT